MKNKKLYIVIFMLVACVPFAHAYRDLETGTFLTRDPIGYADGPNIYCYVHSNPITHFDPFGLKIDWKTLPETDRAVLDELRKEDPVFNEQIQALVDSPHEWKFDNGMGDDPKGGQDIYDKQTGEKLDRTSESAQLKAMNGEAELKPMQVYQPGVKQNNLTDPKGAETPGKGSGGTISWSASQSKETGDGVGDPKSVLSHETQHAVDANAGVLDHSTDDNGLKVSENRAVRRQNDSQKKRDPNAALRKTYTDRDGKTYDVKDYDKPLDNPTPEPDDRASN